MPLHHALGRFNVHVTDRVVGTLLLRLPGYGRLVHVGRRSGRVRRTPVLLFRRGERAVVALTYGRRTDWLHNILAAGEYRFERDGLELDLADPVVVDDPRHRLVPRPVGWVLTLLGADDAVVLRVRTERSHRRSPIHS